MGKVEKQKYKLDNKTGDKNIYFHSSIVKLMHKDKRLKHFIIIFLENCLLFVSTYFRAIHLFTQISPISLYLYSLYTPISLYLSPYSPIPFSYNPNNTFSGVIGSSFILTPVAL